MAMPEQKQKLFLFELARNGFHDAAYDPETGRISLQPDRPQPIQIDDSGSVFYTMEDRDLALGMVRALSESVNEAIAAWDRGQPVPTGNVPEFRVMAEYNNIVLAARDDTAQGYGFHYVTWEYTHGRTGLNRGNYTEDFAFAKQDFAVRAGLLPKHKLLTPEQAASVRQAVAYRLDHDYEMLPAAEDALKDAARKLERGYPGPLVKDYLTPEQMAGQEESRGMELEL